MNFSRPVTDIIRERTSVRKYQDRPLSEEHLQFMKSVIQSVPHAPFGHQSLFSLLVAEDQRDWGRLPGTYGLIRGATTFLIGGTLNEAEALLDFGYQMECLILKAWDAGLGTCWLGGTYQRQVVERRIDLPDDYFIPAISPVGYSAEKEGLIDDVMHRLMGSRQRKSKTELFFQDHWTTALDESADGVLSTALEMVRLGPSAMNRQPWRILKVGNDYHFMIQKGGLNSLVSGGKLPLIDLGIACCHFELTMKEKEHKGQWVKTKQGHTLEGYSRQYCITWNSLDN